MKSYFKRFLHPTPSHSNGKPQSTPILSYSGLTRISRLNKFATWFDLDTPIKSECDTLGKSASTGRSMVEMLGVLAIIGVLSVGGIAGYSKAMMKYKLNKQSEQLNALISVGTRYSHAFSVAGYAQSSLIKIGEIPSEMIKDNDTIYDIFNIEYRFDYAAGAPTGPTLVAFIHPNLKKKSAETFDICRNLVIAAKEARDNLAYISTDGWYGDNNNHRGYGYYGDKYCTDDLTCLRDLTMDDIYTLCTNHIGANDSLFSYAFD